MRWREAAFTIAALFVVTRGAIILVALFVEGSIPLGYHGPSYATGPVMTSLTGSDSVYLLGIAAEGYHAEPVRAFFRDWAFFPLYPLVVRAASFFTVGDIALAGVLVANLAFLAALAVLYALSVRYLDHDRAVRSLAFIGLAPGAVAFAMAYSDSLFLLLAAASFLAAEQRRWLLMGLLYGLAALTRLQGIALGIPLAILVANSGAGWRNVRAWQTVRLAPLCAGPVGFALFSAYLWRSFGDPLGMFTAQRAWSQIGEEPIGPLTPVLSRTDPIVLLLVGIVSLYVFLIVFIRRDRLPAAYATHAVLSLALSVASGRLQSTGRYVAVVWPFDWLLANRRATVFELVGLAGFATLFVIHALLNFTQALAP